METTDIIRTLCKNKGISVTDLEKELGFGNGSLTKSSTLRSDRLLAIAKYFDVSMEYLMGEPEPNRQQYYYNDETAKIAQELFDNPEQRFLMDASRDSKPENIRLAAEMLKRFKETNPEG